MKSFYDATNEIQMSQQLKKATKLLKHLGSTIKLDIK